MAAPILNARAQTTEWRDISALVPNRISGSLYLMREGGTVWLDFSALVCADPTSGTWHTWSAFLADGFRPARDYAWGNLTPQLTSETAGPVRAARLGALTVYKVVGTNRMTGLVSFPTLNSWPTALPGVPA